MSDAQLRRLERLAAGGDDNARAQLTAMRLRAGTLARRRVEQAAHLRDPVAVQVDPGALPKIKCTCGGLALCGRCRGAGAYALPTDLVPFIRQAEIDTGILLAWACDCAEHVLPRATEDDREPLRTIIGKVRELSPELRSLSARTGTPADCMVNRGAQLLVNAAEMVRSLQPAAQASQALAGVATCAYRAAGNTRAERDWQIANLTRRLLG